MKGTKRVVSLVVFDFCKFFFQRRVDGRSLSFKISRFSRSAFLKRLVIVETGGSVESSGKYWEFIFRFINDVGG